jgi:hypothetical protein
MRGPLRVIGVLEPGLGAIMKDVPEEMILGQLAASAPNPLAGSATIRADVSRVRLLLWKLP